MNQKVDHRRQQYQRPPMIGSWPRDVAQTVLVNYEMGFHRCYPQTKMEVRKAGFDVHGEAQYRVLVNGSPDDIVLTLADMKDATKGFNRGRVTA